MVKTWTVKVKGRKATCLRREPVHEHSSANVLRIVKNGDTVVGEFMHVQRASREVGFVKVKHLEHQCGVTMAVRNADSSPTTIIRKQPTDALGEANTVGYAAEAELLTGEYIFVRHKDEKRGGYIKLSHLRPKSEEDTSASGLTAFDGEIVAQRWAVLDAVHDGVWLRKTPTTDRSEKNLAGLARNGTLVAGEYVHVRRKNGDVGFARFRDLEQLSPKAWRVRSAKGSTPLIHLRKEPRETEDIAVRSADIAVPAGEALEGEFVFVTTGKKVGFVKRHYLTALLAKPAPEVAASSRSTKRAGPAVSSPIAKPRSPAPADSLLLVS